MGECRDEGLHRLRIQLGAGYPAQLRMRPLVCTPTTMVAGDGLDNECDGRVDEEEHKFLAAFTQDFLRSTNGLILESPYEEDLIRHGICAMQPDVAFAGKLFCVTGSSPRASRRELEAVVAQLGGKPHPRVVKGLDYLIVAAERSLCWAFSCYGRKVEAAMALRKDGARLTIVHESDFWDAAADHGVERRTEQR